MPFGWDEGVGIYIAETLSQHPGISAKELARKIVLRAERNDNYRLLDDTSCCVIYRRTPRNLLICTGPPYDEKKTGIWQKKSGISKVKSTLRRNDSHDYFKGTSTPPAGQYGYHR